ncbi:hypothetical protein CWO90_05655 [Bradyrhizobium sp. Leo121]|nr:hypothetical protein CWO90_05655 [Bradyrhizobium sp. Leo121]
MIEITPPGQSRSEFRQRQHGNRGGFFGACSRAFSSEVDTGSREENAPKQESRASVLISSEPKWSRRSPSPAAVCR